MPGCFLFISVGLICSFLSLNPRWKTLDGREERETLDNLNAQEFTVDKFRNYVVQGLKMGIAVGVGSMHSVTGRIMFHSMTSAKFV